MRWPSSAAAAAGFFVSAPLGHTLLAILQKAFAGKTSARAKLGMIIASNLFISPIQQSVYIAAMAIINGATTPQAVINAWKMSIWRVMKLSWVVSTVSMAIAQRFLPPEIWGESLWVRDVIHSRQLLMPGSIWQFPSSP